MSDYVRQRNSNRKILEVFAYLKLLLKLFSLRQVLRERKKIRKFVFWIKEISKKSHQKIKGLMGAGSANILLKAFDKIDIPAILIIVSRNMQLTYLVVFTP